MAYIGANPVNGFFEKQDLTTDGSTTTFTLNTAVGSSSAILVSVGGVIQEPEVAYNLGGGGGSIIFTEAPSSTADTYVHFLGQAIAQSITDLNGTEMVLDVDADTTITADTDDQIDFKLGGSDVIAFKTTGIHLPDGEKYVGGTGDDLQLYHDGSNSYLANSTGELRLATLTSGIAIAIGHSTSEVTFGDNVTVTGNLTIGGTTNFGDFNITNVGSIALDTITNDGTDITLDSSGDIILDAAGNDIFFKAGGTTIGEFTNSSSDLVIKSSVSDKDILIKGNDGGATITALTLDMSAAGAATFNSTVTTTGLVIGSTAVTSTAAELNLLDGVSGLVQADLTKLAALDVTATELNLLDDKDATNLALTGKQGGTNFARSILIGHATTGTISSAEDNLGIGDNALNSVTSGDQNVCLGSNAGTAITTGTANVYIGRNAGSGNATGSSNFGLGIDCLEDGSFTGTSNVAIGRSAGAQVESGNFNILMGQSAGDNITTGHGNLIIGANVDADSVTGSRQLKIAGYDGTTTTTWIAGDSSGNLTFAGDVTVGDDLNLTTDSTVINFGADSDTTLTHTDGAGLTLNSTNKLMFNDASQFIQGASATVLDIAATDEIELTATLIEVVGNATVSGTLGVTGVTTSNAGVVVDNITIDGTEIDLSSGDLLVDVAGDITLDAGGGNVKVAVAGTDILDIANSSSDVIIKPVVDAKDIIFQQADGTSILEINDGAYAKFTAAAVAPEATLTDASTITWNSLTQSVAKVTLGANRTMGLASGGVTGAFISLLVIQDGTGSRTITWNAAYEFAADTAPTLTTTANLGDLFVFRYNGAKWLEVGRNLALTLS